MREFAPVVRRPLAEPLQREPSTTLSLMSLRTNQESRSVIASNKMGMLLILPMIVFREDDRGSVFGRGLPIDHLRSYRHWRPILGSEHLQAREGLCLRHCFLEFDGEVSFIWIQ